MAEWVESVEEHKAGEEDDGPPLLCRQLAELFGSAFRVRRAQRFFALRIPFGLAGHTINLKEQRRVGTRGGYRIYELPANVTIRRLGGKALRLPGGAG